MEQLECYIVLEQAAPREV